jgi:hypothetical protein
MSQDKIRDVITHVINACQEKNASVFASFFTAKAVMRLANGNSYQNQQVIYQVTEQYFAQLKTIKITLIQLTIGHRQALLEWYWQHSELKSAKTKLTHNLIKLEFRDNLINFWVEIRC